MFATGQSFVICQDSFQSRLVSEIHDRRLSTTLSVTSGHHTFAGSPLGDPN